MFTANTLYKNKQMSIKILVCVNKEQIHEGRITLFILDYIIIKIFFLKSIHTKVDI